MDSGYIFEQINIHEDFIEEITDDTGHWINKLIKRINDNYPNIDTIDYMDYCKVYEHRQFDIEDNTFKEIEDMKKRVEEIRKKKQENKEKKKLKKLKKLKKGNNDTNL